jgi:hypothetical protein
MIVAFRSRRRDCDRNLPLAAVLLGLTMLASGHRANKSISPAAQRLNKMRPARVVAQGAPDLPDTEIQPRFEVDKGILLPKMLPQARARHNFAWARGQKAKDLQRLKLHGNWFALEAQFRSFQVEVKPIEEQTSTERMIHTHLARFAGSNGILPVYWK